MSRRRPAASSDAAGGRAGTMVSELEVDPRAAVDQEFDQEPIQEAKNPIKFRFGSRSGPAVRDQIARAAANNSSAAHKRSSCEERIDRIEKAIEKLLQEPRSHRHSSRRSGRYKSSNESGKESDGNGQYRRLPHGRRQHSSHYQRHREGGKSYQHQENHQGGRRSGTHHPQRPEEHWTSDDSEEESEGRGGSRRSPTVRKNSYEKPAPFKGSQGGYCPPHLPNKSTSSPFPTHITCAANKPASKVTMQPGDALRKLEERGVVIRFVVGRSANRGDSLDRNIDEESLRTKDFLILESHEEAVEELPKKAKFFFSAAVERWDAEFYVKVDDNINLDLDGLIEILEGHRGRNGVYMGCMKSGAVIIEEGKQWFEPQWWKFGDGKSYFRHAAGPLIILSKNLARYVKINSASLHTYAHDDTSVGSWMMGLDAAHVDDDRLCCSSSRQEKVCSLA